MPAFRGIRARHIHPRRVGGAFSLIELLVVISIIALLVSILLPSLNRAKALARKEVCKTSIRSLQLANEMYQTEHASHYCPAVPKANNLGRWFGSRLSAGPGDTNPFDIPDGPLLAYLPGKAVRDCPEFENFNSGFETGCGGFGYNQQFVGMFVKPDPAGTFPNAYIKAIPTGHTRTGNHADAFLHPSETTAFTDTAFVNDGLTEYSFCEAPRNATSNFTPRPSIHFRHLDVTNVAWLDCHVSEKTMTTSNNSCGYIYPGNPADFQVGFYGTTESEPASIELFDME